MWKCANESANKYIYIIKHFLNIVYTLKVIIYILVWLYSEYSEFCICILCQKVQVFGANTDIMTQKYTPKKDSVIFTVYIHKHKCFVPSNVVQFNAWDKSTYVTEA